ncbi:Alpha/beta hydrolase family protein [Corynebacterium ciconiae DSM 44920]|uniref:alpha/beta hydrolase n=1 Tax=Corynebacterium ciconiae TaxID=227319 RepID=UPI000360913E|nr:alpha/beta hydrolase [Corynebacterium ciconiae]WKD60122.1 Alpha/beta hydrolase family protein [Corynebacterium ciconiae DSM 44920]
MLNKKQLTIAGVTGVLTMPAQPRETLVVMAHCFGCSKETKILVKLARFLADQGYSSLRMDFSRHLYSTYIGELEAVTQAMLGHVPVGGHDGEAAADAGAAATARFSRVILLGHSLGGLAVLSAAARSRTTGLAAHLSGAVVLSAPATAHHVEAAAADVPDLDPSLVDAAFLEDVAATAETEFSDCQLPVLIVHPEEDSVVGFEHGQRLQELLPHSELIVVPHCADHMFVSTAARTAAEEAIKRWLPQREGGTA